MGSLRLVVLQRLFLRTSDSCVSAGTEGARDDEEEETEEEVEVLRTRGVTRGRSVRLGSTPWGNSRGGRSAVRVR